MSDAKVVEKRLGRSGAWGQYKEWSKTIEIDPRLVGKKKLYVYVHEFTHHMNPDWSEAKVTKFSKALTNFLWMYGTRMVDNRERQPKSK